MLTYAGIIEHHREVCVSVYGCVKYALYLKSLPMDIPPFLKKLRLFVGGNCGRAQLIYDFCRD